jgi:hypothetical protein
MPPTTQPMLVLQKAKHDACEAELDKKEERQEED